MLETLLSEWLETRVFQFRPPPRSRPRPRSKGEYEDEDENDDEEDFIPAVFGQALLSHLLCPKNRKNNLQT
jgi:hypothetical protein